MEYFLLIVGFAILIFGGNWLLKAAVGISLKLEIPRIVIGMTVVSLATSAPELIVSLNSALDGHADIALGNVIGSNIANLGLVLGIVTIVSTIQVEKSFYRTDWPIMMLASLLLYGFMFNDEVLQRWEGAVFICCLFAFLIILLKFRKAEEGEDIDEEDTKLSNIALLFYFVIGAIGLWGGSELLIDNAIIIAKNFNVSERLIGITIISVGTSIPELAASIVAVIKKEKAISLGNLLGSNIFNILAVLGITAVITPIKATDPQLMSHDIMWMLLVAVMIFPLVFAPIRMKLSWKEGLILVATYTVFITLMF